MRSLISQFTMPKIVQGVLVLGLSVLTITSCNDINFNGPQTAQGHMDFHLTDAPGDYQEVNVDVQGLRIHLASADNDTASSDTTDGEWIDLPVDPMRIDLLTLAGDVDTLLSSANLDPGHYNELRLILGPDNDVVIDSVTHALDVPSGQQSGYKIKFSTDLESGEDLDVTIDFDAEESVVKAGMSGKYLLKPVLTAFVDE